MLDLAQIRSLVEEELLPGAEQEDSPWLVDIELTGDGKGRVIRFLVDTDRGIGVDQLGHLSRSIGALLDQEDLVPFRYRLEVCSPGLTRPLKSERQFRKAVGHDLRLRWREEGPEGLLEHKCEGRLQAVDERTLSLAAPEGERTIPRAMLVDAVYKLNW